jgi:hypothetical protein
MDAREFVIGTGCAVDEPRFADANPEGRMPGGRGAGVSFLLVIFSLDKQRKVTRRLRSRLRKLLILAWLLFE